MSLCRASMRDPTLSVETQQLGFRRIEHDFFDLNDLLNSVNSCKTSECAFGTCPKQGLEMEAVVLHRVGFLVYFCPKQGQYFKPSAAPLYPNMGQVPPPPPREFTLRQMVKVWPRDNSTLSRNAETKGFARITSHPVRGCTGKNKAFCSPGTQNGRRVIKVYCPDDDSNRNVQRTLLI